MSPDCDEFPLLVTDPSSGIDRTRSTTAGPVTPHNRQGPHSGTTGAYGDA